MKTTQAPPDNPATVRERAYQYHVKGLTCSEIGKLLYLSPRTVERYSQTDRWRERANPQPLAARAADLQRQGFSYAQIARTLGISKSTVYAYLRTKSGTPTLKR